MLAPNLSTLVVLLGAVLTAALPSRGLDPRAASITCSAGGSRSIQAALIAELLATPPPSSCVIRVAAGSCARFACNPDSISLANLYFNGWANIWACNDGDAALEVQCTRVAALAGDIVEQCTKGRVARKCLPLEVPFLCDNFSGYVEEVRGEAKEGALRVSLGGSDERC